MYLCVRSVKISGNATCKLALQTSIQPVDQDENLFSSIVENHMKGQFNQLVHLVLAVSGSNEQEEEERRRRQNSVLTMHPKKTLLVDIRLIILMITLTIYHLCSSKCFIIAVITFSNTTELYLVKFQHLFAKQLHTQGLSINNISPILTI